MKDQKKAEEIAAQRMQLLSPLLDKGLDPGQARQIKARICEESGISERTLRRYLSHYRKDGFNGLKPKGKGGRGEKPYQRTFWNKPSCCAGRYPAAAYPR